MFILIRMNGNGRDILSSLEITGAVCIVEALPHRFITNDMRKESEMNQLVGLFQSAKHVITLYITYLIKTNPVGWTLLRDTPLIFSYEVYPSTLSPEVFKILTQSEEILVPVFTTFIPAIERPMFYKFEASIS